MDPSRKFDPAVPRINRDVVESMRRAARAASEAIRRVQGARPETREAADRAPQVKVRECAALAVQNPPEADFYYRLAAKVWTQHLLDACVSPAPRPPAMTAHVRITGLGEHYTSPERRAVEEWVDVLLTDGTPEAVRRLVDALEDAA